MTLYFANHGCIDLAAVMTMGVSVKAKDAPIGYFGTGVKFAIATLLRTGHRITLHRDGEAIQFSARPTSIRGTEFRIVHMDETPLGYTTDLGKNWEPWQAYRELRSNAMDEDGIVLTECDVAQWDTVFEVHGKPIEDAHRDRKDIFLETEPIHTGIMCAIHPGPSRFGFYRGICAATLRAPAMLTYNLVCDQKLTEDRTLASPHSMETWAGDTIPELTDEALLESLLFASTDTFEGQLRYPDSAAPSEAFMRVVQRHAHNARLNRSAVELWRKKARAEIVYEPVNLDIMERAELATALALCARLGAEIAESDFTIVEDLGADVLGVTRHGRIVISRRCFDMGARTVAGTLFEEWLHLKQRKEDCSRAMQNYLLDKVFALVEKVRFLEARSAQTAQIHYIAPDFEYIETLRRETA